MGEKKIFLLKLSLFVKIKFLLLFMSDFFLLMFGEQRGGSYTYIHTNIHTYIRLYIYIYIYQAIRMHGSIYMHTYIHGLVYLYICMNLQE